MMIWENAVSFIYYFVWPVLFLDIAGVEETALIFEFLFWRDPLLNLWMKLI